MARILNILTVVGARPQFVKAAAISRAISKDDRVAERIVHTGQHFDLDMSRIFFEELEIPEPAFNLQVSGGHHGDMTGRMLIGLEKLMIEERPDAVLVYGDTNSTLAGALAAAKLQIPVIHVEAGLRSSNREMPEEINRVLADHISSILLCPTRLSVQNLSREGIVDGVHHVGDVMYDATLFARARAASCPDILQELDLDPGRYAIATVHRAENTASKETLREVIRYLERQACICPVIIPIHPRTREAMLRYELHFDRVKAIKPVGYFDMHRMMSEASVIITDSGGIQKEAYFHGTPCITLRGETEWKETIESGWNRLWTQNTYNSRKKINDYGDGKAAEKCVSIVIEAMYGWLS